MSKPTWDSICPSCQKPMLKEVLTLHDGLCASCFHLNKGRAGIDKCPKCKSFILTTEESRRRRWRGRKTEDELVLYLKHFGWRAFGAMMAVPGVDVIAFGDMRLVFFECKHGRNLGQERLDEAVVQVTQDQLLRLKEQCLDNFTVTFGYLVRHGIVKFEGVIAAKFPYRGFKFHLLTPEDYEKASVIVHSRDEDTWKP